MVLSGLQDRLSPLNSWLFPQRVYLQLEDQAFTAMVLEGECIAWQERVPLPPGLCVNGEPLLVEALGDLLGDLLVERGYPGAHVKAVLPRAATAWRVIEWPDAAWPEQPELLVRHQQDQLALPWTLQDADLWLEPLLGDPPRSLLVTAQRTLLEAWIEVFSQAGVALDGLEPLPICLWRAVKPQLGEGVQAVLQLEADCSWLLALDQGQPLGEWLLPPPDQAEALAAALRQWRERQAPVVCTVVGPDALVQALNAQLPSLFGCPVHRLELPGGEAALWGLVAGEQVR